MVQKKQEHSVNSSYAGRNVFFRTDRMATKITSLYNCDEQKRPADHTNVQTGVRSLTQAIIHMIKSPSRHAGHINGHPGVQIRTQAITHVKKSPLALVPTQATSTQMTLTLVA